MKNKKAPPKRKPLVRDLSYILQAVSFVNEMDDDASLFRFNHIQRDESCAYLKLADYMNMLCALGLLGNVESDTCWFGGTTVVVGYVRGSRCKLARFVEIVIHKVGYVG